MYAILVLNDGKTWTRLDGSSICIIREEEYDELCVGMCPSKIDDPVFEMRLTDCTLPQEIETIYRVKEGGDG